MTTPVRSIAAAPLVLGLLLLSGCASSDRHRTGGGPSTLERGVASWYGPGFDGRMTASGERYDMHALTAAHRTLPFGTLLEVRNLDNGQTTQVRINDRGPFKKDRIVDLSLTAARAIGMVGPGTARVELRTIVLGGGDRRYVVQVGAFQEQALADALVSRLRPEYPGGRPEIRRGLAPGAVGRLRRPRRRRRPGAQALAPGLRRAGHRRFPADAYAPGLLTPGFTAAAGTSPSSAASTMWAVSIAMRSCASLVCAPMCGVATTLGCAVRAWRWVGSSS